MPLLFRIVLIWLAWFLLLLLKLCVVLSASSQTHSRRVPVVESSPAPHPQASASVRKQSQAFTGGEAVGECSECAICMTCNMLLSLRRSANRSFCGRARRFAVQAAQCVVALRAIVIWVLRVGVLRRLAWQARAICLRERPFSLACRTIGAFWRARIGRSQIGRWTDRQMDR